jgi:hypothetical protein
VTLSPTADGRFSPHTRKSKRWTERRGSAPRSGANEWEAECFRVVEIAQRYDLDRVYHGETSGWQSLEEYEQRERRIATGMDNEMVLEAEERGQSPRD